MEFIYLLLLKKTTYFVAFINLFVGVLVRELLYVHAYVLVCMFECVA